MAGQRGFNLLFPLIFAIIVALGAIAMAVSFDADVTKLKTDKARIEKTNSTLKSEQAELIAQILDLKKFIDGTEGDEGTVSIEDLRNKFIKKANERVGVEFKGEGRQKTYTSFVELYPDLFDEIHYWKEESRKNVNQIKGLEKSLESSENSLKTIKDSSDEQITKLTEDKKKDVDQLRSEIVTKDEEIDSLKEKRNNAQSELQTLKDNYETVKTPEFENRIKVLKQRLSKLKETILERKKLTDLDPDGEVIVANQSLGYVWVNIGRAHSLRKGLIFRVFQYIKGGKRRFKGKIEIIRVDVDMAQARILKQLYRNEPLIKGDYIISPIFDKNKKKNFVFAGRKAVNHSYSPGKYKQMLEKHNQIVEDNVNNRTDFVVLLDGYEDSKEYEDAKAFPWVIFLRESDILEFLIK